LSLKYGFDVYMRRAVEGGEPIFPEKFCVGPDPEGKKTDLEQLKISQGAFHFSAQYLNDPVDEESIEFKRSWVRNYEICPEEGEDLLFIDPAFGLKPENDFTGMVLTRTSVENVVYVMEALRVKGDPGRLVKEIFRLHKLYPKIKKTFVETTVAQVMLAHLIRVEMLARNDFFLLEEYKPSTREKKATRIRGLIPRFEAGGIQLRQGLSDLYNELIEFPRGTHDDLIDALAHGVTEWRAPNRRVVEEKKEGTFNWWMKKVPQRGVRMGGYFSDMIRGRR